MKRLEGMGLFLFVLWISVPFHIAFAEQPNGSLPAGFVYVESVIPDIVLDLRYYTAHNFVGERIVGI